MRQFIMGLDVGYGNTKAVYSNEAGVEHNLVLPSVAHEILDLEHHKDMTATGKTDQVLVEVEGRHFTVGPSAAVFGRTLHDNYILTPQYRALVIAALYAAFEEIGDATDTVDALVVGLPVYSFSRMKDQLREQMLKPFEVPMPAALRGRLGASITVQARSVRVMPQPVGAVTDWRSRASGSIGPQDIVTVCDPGYKTFDWFSMRGSVVVPELSGAFDGGVSELLKDVGGDHPRSSERFAGYPDHRGGLGAQDPGDGGHRPDRLRAVPPDHWQGRSCDCAAHVGHAAARTAGKENAHRPPCSQAAARRISRRRCARCLRIFR